MAYRINHVNKRNGITYVYESTSYWNKEKKQPRSKQVCIGKLDLEKLLKSCFPKSYQQIQIMAYYLVAYGGALSRCEVWSKNHVPELTSSLTSQRISELLCSITLNDKHKFCTQWMDKIISDDYLCYDITSISSYAESNQFIRYEHNRDKEQLPQLNLAMLYGQKEHL